MMRYSNQSAGGTNNQCNRGLIVINNWGKKGRKMIACTVLKYLFHMFLLQYIKNRKIKFPKSYVMGKLMS